MTRESLDLKNLIRLLEALYQSIDGDLSHSRRHSTQSLKSPLFNGILKLSTSVPVGAHWNPRSLREPLFHRLEDWNPLSQRVIFTTHSKTAKNFGKSFESIQGAAVDFVGFTHELSHVLLWEPFFTGQVGKFTRSQFIQASQMFEGYCFWFSDLVVTPQVRAMLPDGELTFEKAPVSTDFLPHRAFRALGISKSEVLLSTYLKAFCGERTALLNGTDPYVGSLAKRIFGEYEASIPMVGRSYDRLREAGIFGEFWERYCNIADLPALEIGELSSMSREALLHYCSEVSKNALGGFSSLPDAIWKSVRMRRGLQTRAYYAHSLRFILNERSYFSLKGAKHAATEALDELEHYLDACEDLLHSLARGASVQSIGKACHAADLRYEAKIKAKLRKSEYWLSHRPQINPFLDVPKCSLGEIDARTTLKVRQKKELVQYLHKYCVDYQKISRESEEIFLLEAELARLSLAQGAQNDLKFSKKLNELIKKPAILERWSVPLYACAPSKNVFRELLYSYQ